MLLTRSFSMLLIFSRFDSSEIGRDFRILHYLIFRSNCVLRASEIKLSILQSEGLACFTRKLKAGR